MKTLKKPKITRIAITKARINLGALVKRAHLKDEYFILEKSGIPIAGLMDADELEDYLDVHDPKTQREIKEGWEEFREGKTHNARELLKEIEKELKIKK